MGRLTGKVALITGAARGQGAAEARLFAAEGATVVATDVLDEPGEELAAKLRSEGGSTVYLHLDVAWPEQWQSVVDHVRKAHGRLDVQSTMPAWRSETGCLTRRSTNGPPFSE